MGVMPSQQLVRNGGTREDPVFGAPPCFHRVAVFTVEPFQVCFWATLGTLHLFLVPVVTS